VTPRLSERLGAAPRTTLAGRLTPHLFFVVLHDPAGDVDQFHLCRLRGPCESLEGLYPGEVVSLHQNSFGLTYEVAACKGRFEL
jgi:hypothetical protein